ncbi:MAG: YjbQ family protein [Dehalococcoidia bacterium]|nr:MAG: YjbQ family protein [Dehalococcoidia bacterium]
MIITKQITIETGGNGDMRDITSEVAEQVSKASVNSGTVTVFVAGSTAGVTTIEYEPGLQADFAAMWERLVPRNLTYQHNERWGDGNGYAHIRASLLGPSLAVPFRARKLLLGTWQQIVVTDFDNRHRRREVILQIMGE